MGGGLGGGTFCWCLQEWVEPGFKFKTVQWLSCRNLLGQSVPVWYDPGEEEHLPVSCPAGYIYLSLYKAFGITIHLCKSNHYMPGEKSSLTWSKKRKKKWDVYLPCTRDCCARHAPLVRDLCNAQQNGSYKWLLKNGMFSTCGWYMVYKVSRTSLIYIETRLILWVGGRGGKLMS